jgi:hypothetical protein
LISKFPISLSIYIEPNTAESFGDADSGRRLETKEYLSEKLNPTLHGTVRGQHLLGESSILTLILEKSKTGFPDGINYF